MSHTLLYGITADGEIQPWDRFQNAHGWCPFIWESLCRRYEVKRRREASDWRDPDGMDMSPYSDWGYLWHLHGEGQIGLRPHEANVLASTYDRHVVRSDDFNVYARSLEMFHRVYTSPERVDHTQAVAEVVRRMPTTLMGLCFYPMSVSQDTWYEYNAETDESAQYDFSTRTDHKFVEMRRIPFG